jgi:transposase
MVARREAPVSRAIAHDVAAGAAQLHPYAEAKERFFPNEDIARAGRNFLNHGFGQLDTRKNLPISGALRFTALVARMKVSRWISGVFSAMRSNSPASAPAATRLKPLNGPLVSRRSGAGWSQGSAITMEAKSGRPPFDPVLMFKVLIEQTHRNLSDALPEFTLLDRLSWMRFAGFDLGAATPYKNTIRRLRTKSTDSGPLHEVLELFDLHLRTKGFLPMSGQIVDASLVPAPKQRTADADKMPPHLFDHWEKTVLF